MRSTSLDIGACYSRCAFVNASSGTRFSWIAARPAGDTRARRESRQQEGRGMMRISQRLLRPALAAALLVGLAGAPAAAETVLKLVPQADLKILDPFFTTGNITSNHGYMIYDNLFALDDKLEPKPEMVDIYALSPDKLVWSFTLRDGLKFSDGIPVEGKDVVASIKRWAARIPAGQALMRY